MPVGTTRNKFSVPKEAMPTVEQLKALDGKMFTNASLLKHCVNCGHKIEIDKHERFLYHDGPGVYAHGAKRCFGSRQWWRYQK